VYSVGFIIRIYHDARSPERQTDIYIYGFHHKTCGYLNMSFVFIETQRIENLVQSGCSISGLRHEVAENCGLLGHYAASSGNFLPTFRENLSVPYSGVVTDSSPLWMGPTGCPEMSVTNCHYPLHKNPEERRSFLISTLSGTFHIQDLVFL